MWTIDILLKDVAKYSELKDVYVTAQFDENGVSGLTTNAPFEVLLRRLRSSSPEAASTGKRPHTPWDPNTASSVYTHDQAESLVNSEMLRGPVRTYQSTTTSCRYSPY